MLVLASCDRSTRAALLPTSVSKKAHILFGTKSLLGLGLNKRVFAVIAIGERSGMRLGGRIVWGKRVRGVWMPTDIITIK
jgi:hypothetical protein